MRRMIAMLFGRAHEPAADTPRAVAADERRALPRELLIAIEGASVFWRPSREDDDTAGPIVVVVGVGRWVWDGVADAQERVARSYPELAPRHCQRAARLIRGQIGLRNRQAFRRSEARRSALDRALDEEHAYFGGIFRDD
ncbi:MAG: hypothetical protein H5U24_20095 [Thioclava marina]|uniref:hypothetical protein n=1 Tax=Thioclava marina TaxID=1915077 RepID=UPI001984A057|nr:hypothetical protein [Thioclava marina]MBC7147669.1 hypothetical protein [Thioclava marina]